MYVWMTLALLFVPADNKSMLNAIEYGDAATVAQLLDQGADPNSKIGGETILACAAKEGHDEIVRLLLDRGAEISHRRGKNPFTQAMHNGRVSCVKTLMEYGGNVNVKDSNGRTPLILATLDDNHSLTRLFIDAGADLDVKDNRGNTALHYAVKRGNVDAVELLVKGGANLEAKDRRGNTALAYAKFCKQVNIFSLMVEGRRVIEDPNVLHRAAEVADVGKFLMALRDGYNINSANQSSITPFLLASRSGDVGLLTLMLNKGADPNAEDSAGNTALMYAASEGRLEAARLLLDKGVALNAKNNQGQTALGFAAARRDVALATLLAQKGARFMGTDQKGRVRTLNEELTPKSIKKQIKKFPETKRFLGVTLDMPGVTTPDDPELTLPIFTRHVAPDYPQVAFRGGVQGWVILKAVLGANGMIRDIHVVKDLGDWQHGFEYNAIAALKQWQFRPGIKHGQATDVEMDLRIEFVR